MSPTFSNRLMEKVSWVERHGQRVVLWFGMLSVVGTIAGYDVPGATRDAARSSVTWAISGAGTMWGEVSAAVLALPAASAYVAGAIVALGVENVSHMSSFASDCVTVIVNGTSLLACAPSGGDEQDDDCGADATALVASNGWVRHFEGPVLPGTAHFVTSLLALLAFYRYRPRCRLQRWAAGLALFLIVSLSFYSTASWAAVCRSIASIFCSRFPYFVSILGSVVRAVFRLPWRWFGPLIAYLCEAEWDLVEFESTGYCELLHSRVQGALVPHALNPGAEWVPVRPTERHAGVITFYVKQSAESKLLTHSQAFVGVDCLFGPAHCFHDSARSLLAFHKNGYKIYWATSCATVGSGSVLKTVPVRWLETLDKAEYRNSPWRGSSDNVTGRDWTQVYFKSAGAHFGTTMRSNAFCTVEVSGGEVTALRASDGVFSLHRVLTGLNFTTDCPTFTSEVGSEPGMSGAPIYSDQVKGVVGVNLGFDPVNHVAVCVGAKQIWAFLKAKGCVTAKGAIVWNEHHALFPKPQESCVPSHIAPPAQKADETVQREAHAPKSRAHHRFREPGRHDSGEAHGSRPEQGVEEYWEKREAERLADAEAEDLTDFRLGPDTGPYIKSAHLDNLQRSQARRDQRALNRRKAHSTEPDVAPPCPRDTGMAAPNGGIPLHARKSLEVNLAEGTEHSHQCPRCRFVFGHTHVLHEGKHDQWDGQCPNPDCARHHPRACELVGTKILWVPPEKRPEAHAPLKIGKVPPGLEGMSATEAAKKAEAIKDYCAVSDLEKELRSRKRDNVKEKVRHNVSCLEAHCLAPEVRVSRAPINDKSVDLSFCVACGEVSEACDGWCSRHLNMFTLKEPQTGPSDAAKRIEKEIHANCPAIMRRLKLSGINVLDVAQDVKESTTTYGKCLFQVTAKTHHSNDPAKYAKPSKVDKLNARKWKELAAAAGIDPKAFFYPPDTLEALTDSLFANCAKRIRPTGEFPAAAVATVCERHVVNPNVPDASQLARLDLVPADIDDLLDGEWADFTSGRNWQPDDPGADWKDFLAELERRVQAQSKHLHRDKSCGFDKFISHHTTKGQLLDDEDAFKEVKAVALERLAILAKYPEVRDLNATEVLRLGLRDPAVPVLKREATPARKIEGQTFKRWRSIMVGSVADELVDRVVQKEHNSRMTCLFQVGADTWSHVGTGSDDRHVAQTKGHLAMARGRGHVLSSDVSGMDACMGAIGYGISAAFRVSCLYASPGVFGEDVSRIENLIVGLECLSSLQSLIYGNCILSPTERCWNKSGVPSTTFNNAHARQVISALAKAIIAMIVGDDGVDVIDAATPEEAKQALTDAALSMGYVLRDIEICDFDQFESCSKLYVGGPDNSRFKFLNLNKGLAKACLSESWSPAVADGLAYECRYSQKDLDRIQAFHDKAVELGLAEPHQVRPVEDEDGDMP